MSNEERALFIFEGEVLEDTLVKSLERTGFLNARMNVKCVFGAEIYQLYQKLKEDGTFPQDIVKLLKDQHTNILDDLGGKDFASIYLFFDYDAHASNADDEKIKELLAYFDNETEHGMLYISYPMAEAIRHYKDKESFKKLTVKCKRTNCPNTSCPDRMDCAREPHYKAIVGNYNPKLASRRLTQDLWKELITAHLCKMNYLVLDVFDMPICIQTQLTIFNKQIEKYISQPCPHVAVLSAFPIFLLDYYGCESMKNKLAKSI